MPSWRTGVEGVEIFLQRDTERERLWRGADADRVTRAPRLPKMTASCKHFPSLSPCWFGCGEQHYISQVLDSLDSLVGRVSSFRWVLKHNRRGQEGRGGRDMSMMMMIRRESTETGRNELIERESNVGAPLICSAQSLRRKGAQGGEKSSSSVSWH